LSNTTHIKKIKKPTVNQIINFHTGHIALYISQRKNKTHKNSNIAQSFASKFSEKNFFINHGFSRLFLFSCAGF